MVVGVVGHGCSAGEGPQSALMLLSRITGVHRAISAAVISPSFFGVAVRAITPKPMKHCWISGSSTALEMAR